MGFKRLYQQILSSQDPLLTPIISVGLILITALVSWWIYNFVINRFERRYKDRPFFQKNAQVFSLLKKAGHSSIIILAGVGLMLNVSRAIGRNAQNGQTGQV